MWTTRPLLIARCRLRRSGRDRCRESCPVHLPVSWPRTPDAVDGRHRLGDRARLGRKCDSQYRLQSPWGRGCGNERWQPSGCWWSAAVLGGCTGTSGVNTQTLDPISTSTASSVTPSSSSTEASPSQVRCRRRPIFRRAERDFWDRQRAVCRRVGRSCSGRIAVGEILGRLPRDRRARRRRIARLWSRPLPSTPPRRTCSATPRSSTARAWRPTAPWAIGFPGRSPSTATSTAVIDDCQDRQPKRFDEDRHRRQESRSVSRAITTRGASSRAMTGCGASSRCTT